MKLSLQSMPKWLWIPPAVALLLVLGPLSMQSGASAGRTNGYAAPPAAGPAPAAAEAGRPARTAPALPRTPDLWQMASALVGVLLLGTGGILVLRKLRGGAVPVRGQAPLVTLRQTLRLSARQAVHAIEFDDRILLVGEHERGITILERGRLLDRERDEADVAARAAAGSSSGDDADDGAVPRDLVIPRPPRRPEPRPATAPVSPPQRGIGLPDFRSLLQKAGRP